MRKNNQLGVYFLAIFILALVTLVATPLHHYLDLANIVMLFLLVVFLNAHKLGRGPAIMSAVLAVALFDFFFVPPKFSFAVHDLQYLVTFLVMLCVGLVTAHLTTRLQEKTEDALKREHDTNRLYKLARELAGATTLERIFEVVKKYLLSLGYQSSLHLVDNQGNLPTLRYEVLMHDLALSALRQSSTLNITQLSNNDSQGFVVPIKSISQPFGVLIIQESAAILDDYQVNVRGLEAVSDLVTITMERLHYVDLAQQTRFEATSERLRSSILSALSHDLRTPLTGLVGMADSLAILSEAKELKIHSAATGSHPLC